MLFGKKSQEAIIREQQSREMQFQREQNTFRAGSNDMGEQLHNEEKESIIKWQQELDDELLGLVYRLKGWKLINKKWMVPTESQPLCNDLFIDSVVIPQCKPFMNRNLINSNLTEKRILAMLKDTSNDIVNNMSDGYDIYNINFMQYDNVLRMIKNTISASAFRALNGWTKKTDSTSFKKIESTFENGNERKKGMWGMLSS